MLVILLLQVGGGWTESIRRSVALLLVACPCALGFGIPLAFSQTVSKLSQSGVIVQNLRGLEFLPQCRAFVFDKTGTLSRDHMTLKNVQIHGERNLAYSLANAVGAYSKHHVVQALSQWAQAESPSEWHWDQIKETVGQGLQARINGELLKVGKAEYACGVCSHQGSVHLNYQGNCLLSFDLEESIDPYSADIISYLSRQGQRSYILSGDQQTRTRDMATKLRIPHERVLAEQTPQDKLEQIQKQRFVMVGNGLNDMLAFAASRVSIAVRGSQALARKEADFFLNRCDIEGVRVLFHAVEVLQTNLKRLYLFSFSYYYFFYAG